MGGLLGLTTALGIILVIRTFTAKPAADSSASAGRTLSDRLAELIAEAGYESITPGQLLATCVGVGIFSYLALTLISGSSTIPLFFAAAVGYLPIAMVRRRAIARRQELLALWPDVVDNLAGSVRAGMALGEGLTQIGHRGPEELRRPFQRFAEDYRATGRFNDCLDRLKANLADPVGDRIVESLRVAREVGGHDLGQLLRTLSQFLREESRTRSELRARQSFTVNSARVAVGAPWVVLGFITLFQPQIAASYNTTTGFIVLLVGAGLSMVAYRMMMRIARLPVEGRVLR